MSIFIFLKINIHVTVSPILMGLLLARATTTGFKGTAGNSFSGFRFSGFFDANLLISLNSAKEKFGFEGLSL
jgi:hypothetical protein